MTYWWHWFCDHGHKMLAGMLTLLTAVNVYAPDQLTAWGKGWALLLLSSGTLVHGLYLGPQAPLRPPE
jgi:hypothetical protein